MSITIRIADFLIINKSFFFTYITLCTPNGTNLVPGIVKTFTLVNKADVTMLFIGKDSEILITHNTYFIVSHSNEIFR